MIPAATPTARRSRPRADMVSTTTAATIATDIDPQGISSTPHAPRAVPRRSLLIATTAAGRTDCFTRARPGSPRSPTARAIQSRWVRTQAAMPASPAPTSRVIEASRTMATESSGYGVARKRFWRWAEPDTAIHVSGQINNKFRPGNCPGQYDTTCLDMAGTLSPAITPVPTTNCSDSIRAESTRFSVMVPSGSSRTPKHSRRTPDDHAQRRRGPLVRPVLINVRPPVAPSGPTGSERAPTASHQRRVGVRSVTQPRHQTAEPNARSGGTHACAEFWPCYSQPDCFHSPPSASRVATGPSPGTKQISEKSGPDPELNPPRSQGRPSRRNRPQDKIVGEPPSNEPRKRPSGEASRTQRPPHAT